MKIFGKEPASRKCSLDLGRAAVKYSIERFRSGYRMTGTIQGRPGKIEILRADAPPSFLMNNWQSWGPMQKVTARSRFLELEDIFLDKGAFVFTPLPGISRRSLVSDYFVAWEKRLLGFLTSRIGHPFFVVEGSELVGYVDFFDSIFNDPVRMEPLVVLGGELVEDLLERYALLINAAHRIRINPWNPIGWCSWYHYFGKLEWGDVAKNLEIAEKDAGLPFEVFQVDDGYESDIGDWLTAKPGYPPLEGLAGAIKKRGFKAGIWTAPFSIAETSQLYREHPGWLVSEGGVPKVCYKGWGKKIYALDTSNPEAKSWLLETFRRLKKAGFAYFKIDFLFAAAMPGTRATRISPIQAYREGLAVIRKAVGNSFVLGCGAPLLPSAGLVDGMRVGEDTAPFWKTRSSPFQGPSAYFALKNALMRQFMHKRLWLNDPDCLLLRPKEVELTEKERTLYALAAGALDNMLIDSDNLELVGRKEKELLTTATSLRGGEARVYGLLDDDFYLIESRGGPSGNIMLAANLSEGNKIYTGISIPARSAQLIRP